MTNRKPNGELVPFFESKSKKNQKKIPKPNSQILTAKANKS